MKTTFGRRRNDVPYHVIFWVHLTQTQLKPQTTSTEHRNPESQHKLHQINTTKDGVHEKPKLILI